MMCFDSGCDVCPFLSILSADEHGVKTALHVPPKNLQFYLLHQVLIQLHRLHWSPLCFLDNGNGDLQSSRPHSHLVAAK